ncbi:hypothetical protein CF394_03155, partial [Tetzosporium hominis]
MSHVNMVFRTRPLKGGSINTLRASWRLKRQSMSWSMSSLRAKVIITRQWSLMRNLGASFL